MSIIIIMIATTIDFINIQINKERPRLQLSYYTIK